MILLDTHALAWLAGDPKRLSARARSAIRRAIASDGIAISSISVWELASLFARGRLRSPGTTESAVAEILDSTGVTIREITPAIAALATQFPESYPGDPADRLIGATARAENLPLVTRDEHLRASPLLRCVW